MVRISGLGLGWSRRGGGDDVGGGGVGLWSGVGKGRCEVLRLHAHTHMGFTVYLVLKRHPVDIELECKGQAQMLSKKLLLIL